nr:MAG TPA: protein of unknown function (DUF4406) [Caudoviricetes sp.]
MKRLFISQPMRGKTDTEILKERVFAIAKAQALTSEEIEVIGSFYNDFNPNAKPLEYLARSIEDLATADIAIFIGDWKNYRGCRIEHLCAVEYGIDRIE